MEYDLHNNISQALQLDIQLIDTDTDTDSGSIDTAGFESLEWLVVSGAIADGDYAIVLQESDDDGASDPFAAVPSELIIGGPISFDNSSPNAVKRIGSIGKKQFQRLRITSSSTATGGTFAVIDVAGNPHSAPTTDDAD